MVKQVAVRPNGNKVFEYTVPATTKRYETWHCFECGRDNIIHDAENSVMVCICKYD